MRVTYGFISYEGAQRREPAGCLWRRGGTTWGLTHPCHLKHLLKRSQTEQLGSVKANEGPFKSPLGRGKRKIKGDGEDCSGISALSLILCRLRGTLGQGMDVGKMVGKYPLSREGGHESHLSSHLGGDRGA